MQTQSYWDLHPEIRDYAASRIGQMRYQELVSEINERWPDRPTNATALSRLSRGLLQGRWRRPAEPPDEPIIEPTEAPSGPEATEVPDTEPEPSEEPDSPPTESSPESPCPSPDSPSTTLRPANSRPNPSAYRFWDERPELREFCAARLRLGSRDIQEEVEASLGRDQVPTHPQLAVLRSGIVAGRWPASEREAPGLSGRRGVRARHDHAGSSLGEMPAAVSDLAATRRVNCLIDGVLFLSGLGCLDFQTPLAIQRWFRHGKAPPVVHFRWAVCRDCPHWLSEPDYLWVRRLKRAGRIIKLKPASDREAA